MEIPAKTSGDDTPPSRKRPAWWWFLFLIFILIPVRFGSWWLTVICLTVLCLLAYLLAREERESSRKN